ncbi:MAG: thrombospondin type 3 repeat-containing protein [Phycisphaerae bacterium]|nr:thrombospondin type 3 repeat-containing protein [Phycisphaerae bacterium]
MKSMAATQSICRIPWRTLLLSTALVVGPCPSLQYPPSNTETIIGVAIANGQEIPPFASCSVDADVVLMMERAAVFTSPAELQAQRDAVAHLLDGFSTFGGDTPLVILGAYPDTVEGGVEAAISTTCMKDNYICLQSEVNTFMAASVVGGMNLADAITVSRQMMTNKCRKRYIILFSDGNPNEPDNPANAELKAKEAAALCTASAEGSIGVSILTVFLNLAAPPVPADATAGEAFLSSQIARSPEGHFSITSPDQVPAVMDAILDLLCNDCNGNGIPDDSDAELDADNDGIPNGCEDCDENGILDFIDVCVDPDIKDCNLNGIPDPCDIFNGTSGDCNLNGVPDECDPDGNNNGIPDECEPGCIDSDGDGVCNPVDNCIFVHNTNQKDADGDKRGDVCDNCPYKSNADQQDTDGDGVGDVCDNCVDVPNADQADADGDGLGDACDNCAETPNQNQADADEDLVGDACDNCPDVANGDQTDADGDGVGNACDNCPETANPDQDDSDDDGIGDVCDNCPDVPNFDQADADGNGVGDACEEQEPGQPTDNENENDNANDNANDNGGDEPEPGQPVVGGARTAPCGLYNGVAIVLLPLTMLLWMGLRHQAARRRVR